MNIDFKTIDDLNSLDWKPKKDIFTDEEFIIKQRIADEHMLMVLRVAMCEIIRDMNKIELEMDK